MRCDKHNVELECRAGCSAHHSNWYCPKCEKGNASVINEEEEHSKPHDTRFKELYIAINEMMAILGADGEVNTRQMATINVMEALAEIDGGEFDVEKVFGR